MKKVFSQWLWDETLWQLVRQNISRTMFHPGVELMHKQERSWIALSLSLLPSPNANIHTWIGFPASPCSNGLIQKKLCLSFFKKYFFIYSTVMGLRCGMWGLSLWPMDSLTVVCGLSCSVARGPLVPWPGIKTKSPALQGRLLTTGPPEKSQKKLHFLVGKKWFYIGNFVWFNLK